MINLYGHDTVFIYSNVSRNNHKIAYVEWYVTGKILFFTELQEAYEWNDFSKEEKQSLFNDTYQMIHSLMVSKIHLAQERLSDLEKIK